MALKDLAGQRPFASAPDSAFARAAQGQLSKEQQANLRKLSRVELLEILVEQGREIENLQHQLEDAQEQLRQRDIALAESGSIAEASLRLNGVFEAAQAAAQQYLDNVRAHAAGMQVAPAPAPQQAAQRSATPRVARQAAPEAASAGQPSPTPRPSTAGRQAGHAAYPWEGKANVGAASRPSRPNVNIPNDFQAGPHAASQDAVASAMGAHAADRPSRANHQAKDAD